MEKFVEMIIERLENKGLEAKKVEVTKNNGMELTGVSIGKENENIRPTVYLNDYYMKYNDGEMDLEQISSDITEKYEEHRVKFFDVNSVLNWEIAKKNLIYVLVGKEKNKELLKDVPYRTWNDMAVIYKIMVPDFKGGIATITVRNQIFEQWGIKEIEMFKVARKNTEEMLPCVIQDINSILEQEIGQKLPMDMEPGMYIISNKIGLNGAGAILYTDVIEDFATACKSDLYILPSSVHECILVPIKKDEDVEDIKSIVRLINATEVRPDEVLTDSVYRYRREQQMFEMC